MEVVAEMVAEEIVTFMVLLTGAVGAVAEVIVTFVVVSMGIVVIVVLLAAWMLVSCAGRAGRDARGPEGQ